MSPPNHNAKQTLAYIELIQTQTKQRASKVSIPSPHKNYILKTSRLLLNKT
jgi:hypothetical protein